MSNAYDVKNSRLDTDNKEGYMRRIVVVGSPTWTDNRTAMAALRRVMAVYRDPYTLVCDMSDGAARYAAAGARTLGWAVEPHEIDPAKCLPDCPTENHRRRGGPTGDWCPAVRFRNVLDMLDSGPDLALFLVRPTGRSAATRMGQAEAKARGIGVWEYVQGGRRGDSQN